jgi:CubicO group peptidase (beta-lactamase class C family)
MAQDPAFHRARRVALTLLLALVAASPATAQEGSLHLDPDALFSYMERLRVDHGLPGVTVAVAAEGEVVFSGGVGLAQLENRVPAHGQTVFNVASVSKVIATVGLMQLVEQGRVDLDDEIQTWLPYYPRKEWPITLRHVLTHTSGTRHYRAGEFGEHGIGRLRHYDDFEEATRMWRDDPLLFEPGTYWNYSTHAFALLHGIIEAVTGEDLEDYLRTRVWEPAGMLATQFDVPDRVVSNRGWGYARDGDGAYRRSEWEDVSYKYTSGGILSTVEDLVRLGSGLMDGTLLRPETLAQMIEPQVEMDILDFDDGRTPAALTAGQALGWRLTEVEGHPVVYHTGTVKDTRSYAAFVPTLGLAVALQANALFDVRPAGEAILASVLGR